MRATGHYRAEEAWKEVKKMARIPKALDKVVGGAAKGGVFDAGLTAARVVPQVVNGQMSAAPVLLLL